MILIKLVVFLSKKKKTSPDAYAIFFNNRELD